jgi:cytoskeletal protein CcmA (bactofilin family)
MTLFARRATLPEPTGYSVIDEQMVIRGEINTQGTIRVDGRLEGRLHRADTIIVGSTGVIVGDVEAREVVVGGSIQGNIVAEGRVEVQASASVRGDVRTAAMLLHEGATVLGHLTVDQTPNAIEPPRLEIARKRTAPAHPG